jgi:hypothetical protein
MGTKNNPSAFDCYNVAEPDEPLFTLLARDQSAPGMVRQWAYERAREIYAGTKPESDRAMVDEARAVALQMERWRLDHRAQRLAEGRDYA